MAGDRSAEQQGLQARASQAAAAQHSRHGGLGGVCWHIKRVRQLWDWERMRGSEQSSCAESWAKRSDHQRPATTAATARRRRRPAAAHPGGDVLVPRVHGVRPTASLSHCECRRGPETGGLLVHVLLTRRDRSEAPSRWPGPVRRCDCAKLSAGNEPRGGPMRQRPPPPPPPSVSHRCVCRPASGLRGLCSWGVCWHVKRPGGLGCSQAATAPGAVGG